MKKSTKLRKHRFVSPQPEANDPYSYWPCCDVKGCDQVSCRGGGCWSETGYWCVCPDHSQMFRDGKPQPQMKQSAIDREKSRDEDGCLPIKQPEATEGKECTCLSRKAIPMGYYFKCRYCGLKIPPIKQPKPEEEGLPVSIDIVNDKTYISVICPDEDSEMCITIKNRYKVHYTLTLEEAKSIADFINNHIQNY